jgi:hypothetical protein
VHFAGRVDEDGLRLEVAVDHARSEAVQVRDARYNAVDRFHARGRARRGKRSVERAVAAVLDNDDRV